MKGGRYRPCADGRTEVLLEVHELLSSLLSHLPKLLSNLLKPDTDPLNDGKDSIGPRNRR